MSNTPSDAEIWDLIPDEWAMLVQHAPGAKALVLCNVEDFARAVLARWGTPQPVPAPLSEREAFESAWEKLHGRRPVLWSHMFACHKLKTPAHSEGKYFGTAEQSAWQMWQTQAAMAAQRGWDAG